MHIVVRARRVLAVHPWIHWAVCIALATAAAVATHGYVARLDAERRSWGTTRQVWVAAADVAAGQPVRAIAADVPVALVPPGAVDEPPGDSLARQRVTDGEIVVGADLTAAPGPAALAAPDTVVVGLVDPLARNAAVGLHVQIAAEGVVLTESAEVVGLSDDVILIAVATRDGPVVASAAHDGLASVLFLP